MQRTPLNETTCKNIPLHVTMFQTWGQFARVSTLQRLNIEYPNYFEQWLVGFTDGDGTFYIYYNEKSKKWSFSFQIGQHKNNLQLLYLIKRNLKCGEVYQDSPNTFIYRIRDRKLIIQNILPIFEKYPLLTINKINSYNKFKNIIQLLENPCSKYSLFSNEFQLQIKNNKYNNNTMINYELSKPWLIGFIEAEGSFYQTKKESNRIVHGFGITQKNELLLLEKIKKIFRMTNIIKSRDNNIYLLDITNSRVIQNVIDYVQNFLLGCKTFEFKLWSRSYRNYKGNFLKLSKIQSILRKYRLG